MATTRETYVLDASVAVKWHLQDEQYAEVSVELLGRYSLGEMNLIAPDQIRYEVPSAIAVATLGSKPRLTVQEGREAIEEFLALGLTTIGTNELILAANQLVHQFAIAFYDALYLALAFETTYALVTADRRFYDRIRRLPLALWITDPRLRV
jgi:predicted nucleic acid-binding protein